MGYATSMARKRRGSAAELDSQQVEILGRSRIKAALIEAGLEVATPERDNGIDLIAYRWSLAGEFVARPLQIKVAQEFSFGIDRKYGRIPGLVMVFVMRVRQDGHDIYALSYPEQLAMAKALGWTKTPSWRQGGGYSTRHPGSRLTKLLASFRMSRDAWGGFFEGSRGRWSRE